jgi:hypothetical protein
MTDHEIDLHFRLRHRDLLGSLTVALDIDRGLTDIVDSDRFNRGLLGEIERGVDLAAGIAGILLTQDGAGLRRRRRLAGMAKSDNCGMEYVVDATPKCPQDGPSLELVLELLNACEDQLGFLVDEFDGQPALGLLATTKQKVTDLYHGLKGRKVTFRFASDVHDRIRFGVAALIHHHATEATREQLTLLEARTSEIGRLLPQLFSEADEWSQSPH